jgi:hypothetical protein
MRQPSKDELTAIQSMIVDATQHLEEARLIEAQLEHAVAKLRRACGAPVSAILQPEDGVWAKLSGKTDTGQPVYLPLEEKES